ncbi:amino acid adenylation domain-containing protein [Verminephrobacter aporrectodeae subsp. tuberculatae]|nr:amino acid adenylation domain-containing protein [Verminephrobacter aporrectodeae subsp. tuberculatae]MCW8204155.1 amino acid adenylation domain-containing protein [Verminephrobacter aporrectodeae subsp. tuberculatae]
MARRRLGFGEGAMSEVALHELTPLTVPGWTPMWTWPPQAEGETVTRMDVPLGDLFAYGCVHSPDKIALVDRRDAYDYATLESLACSMAAALQQGHNVVSGDRVMVVVRKSCRVPPLAVAIWKLGAVYMPVDAEAPPQRLAAMAARTAPKVVITIGAAPELERATVDVETLTATPDTPWRESSYRHRPEDIAYMIHTSGSTGVPKGVEISVESLKCYFSAHNAVLRYHPNARIFSLAAFHFDVSIEDTLLPLSLGGYVYQFNRPITGDIMRKALVAEQITHLIAVSTLLTMMSEKESLITADTFPQMEMIMTGAELCSPRVISLWKQRLPHARVINAYGPTEVTIVCVCHEIAAADFDRTEPYPIGRPLEGVTALLLDHEGCDVTEPGIEGELCLGGTQVMTGYANQPEETAKRIFVRDGIRFYRSGDICRRDVNGDIHFVGRNDAEVKILGRRIHLGEIQNCCLAVPGAERAVVGVIRRGERQLIAAIIVGAGPAVVEAAQRRVGETLPAYMQPAIWALTDANVLSRSGKTNDASLLTRLDERYAPGCDPVLMI